MPIYIYRNKNTDEYVEIFQGMNDKHEYFGENGDEDCWVREYTIPNASIDTAVDPFSENQFIDKTKGKKGTLGDLWDASKELSEKREKIIGKDPVKEEYFKNYSKERGGRKHYLDKPKTVETSDFKISL